MWCRVAHIVAGADDGNRIHSVGAGICTGCDPHRFPFQKGLRLLTILPIITPPFVVGLALTLLLAAQAW